ncbi:MAG: NAD(+) synthase [Clostridia bacterium]|nr:NAD(+) synthase [Clostridia bacterium]
MYDYLRVAVAVPDLSVGDVQYNTDRIIDKMAELGAKNADIALFPELCITGATCQDLFLQKTLLDGAKNQLNRIVEESKKYDFAVVVGLPMEIDSKLFNCAAVVAGGKICGIVPKTHIPNYNEFYERRWFSSADELDCADCEIPVGNNIVFNYKNVRFGVEIGEDAFAPVSVGTRLALSGAELILNASASNEIVGRREFVAETVKNASAKNICAYAYASAGECESTQDVIFSGHSVVAENGSILAENSKIVDTDYIICVDVDMGKIRADRLKNKTFGECQCFAIDVQNIKIHTDNDELNADGSFANVEKSPYIPTDKAECTKRCMNIFEMQTAALAKRLKITGGKAVIGVSGGLDSTLAILVTVNAMKKLGRDASDVIAVTLPCFGTTDRTYNNALQLMQLLGVDAREVNIREACTLHCRDIGHDINKLDVTFENVQARERTQILMDIACEVGGFVIGTGDLSELALGWCTYNGDHMSMYGVNADVPKTLIGKIIETLVDNNVFKGCADVLTDVIATPISPELLPPDEKGNIVQQTESLVGPYALHDFFIYYVLRYGFSPKKIYALACNAFRDDFDGETVLKWLKTFYRRFFAQQFKRSCIPDGVKIGSVDLSPRGGWRMPTDASAKLWLKELDEIG